MDGPHVMVPAEEYHRLCMIEDILNDMLDVLLEPENAWGLEIVLQKLTGKGMEELGLS